MNYYFFFCSLLTYDLIHGCLMTSVNDERPRFRSNWKDKIWTIKFHQIGASEILKLPQKPNPWRRLKHAMDIECLARGFFHKWPLVEPTQMVDFPLKIHNIKCPSTIDQRNRRMFYHQPCLEYKQNEFSNTIAPLNVLFGAHLHFGWQIIQCTAHCAPTSRRCMDWPSKIG